MMASVFKQLVCSLRESEIQFYDDLKNKYYNGETDKMLVVEALAMSLKIRDTLTNHISDLLQIYGTSLSFEELAKRAITDRVMIRKKWNQRKKLIKSS